MTGTALHRADHLEEVATVDVRQTQIEYDDVRWVVDDLLQAGQSGRRGAHCVATFPECPGHRLAYAGVVLDEHHHGHCPET